MTKHETQRNFAKIVRFLGNQENFLRPRTRLELWKYVNARCGTHAGKESIRRYMDDMKQLDPTLDFHIKERAPAAKASAREEAGNIREAMRDIVVWSRHVTRVINDNATTLDSRTAHIHEGLATLAKAMLLEGFDNAAVYDDLVRLAKYASPERGNQEYAPVVGGTQSPQQPVTAEA